MDKDLNEKEVLKNWNRSVRIGDQVQYRNSLNQPFESKSYTVETVAQLLSGHTAVVWLKEKSGCVAVRNCRAIIRAGILSLALLLGLTACHDEESRTENTTVNVCVVNGERVPC